MKWRVQDLTPSDIFTFHVYAFDLPRVLPSLPLSTFLYVATATRRRTTPSYAGAIPIGFSCKSGLERQAKWNDEAFVESDSERSIITFEFDEFGRGRKWR